MISKSLLQRKFSLAALDYEKHALIQSRIGEELIAYLAENDADYRLILDIGTGSASLIGGLSRFFTQARIFGLDIAFGMLRKAKDKGLKRLIQADAAGLPFRKEIFDLAVSNLVYQWVNSLDYAFNQVKEILNPGGKFYFSVFAKGTLCELTQCIREFIPGREISGINIGRDDIYLALSKSGFLKIEIISGRDRELFSDFFELINWLKLIGANQIGLNFPGLSARGMLEKMSKYYAMNFSACGKVSASFEKILVKAEKK